MRTPPRSPLDSSPTSTLSQLPIFASRAKWQLAPISRYLLGVTPLEPGFAKISIQPRVGLLQRVRGVVPTAKGPVTLNLADGILTLTTPSPTEVDFAGHHYSLPAGSHTLR